jgi:quinoprotein glucose dehydrogenase
MTRWGLLIAVPAVLYAQDWRHHGNDAGGSRFSALREIHRGNVTQLQVAWTWKSGDVSDGKSLPVRSAFEATPLAVNGVLYVVTPFNRLVALEGGTGRELWAFDPKLDLRKPYTLYVNRGCSYWTDGRRRRILYGTLDGRLFSIDADTGKPDPAFGREGAVHLRPGFADKWPEARLGITSPPAISRNLVITGSYTSDGEPQGPPGDVRAFDIRTGREVWRFRVVPGPSEFGHDTWGGQSWVDRGGVNAWSLLSVDTKRGIVFLPLTSPSYDFYGGDRPGANLFGNALVALDAATGKRLWHFQTVHHDIWDYDLPAQPVLVDLKRDGVTTPAVVQITKTGFTFVFDRRNGRPLFPIEERPVPPSRIPGEQAWPTQPVPLKPPPFARQGMRREELTTVTPESRRRCEQMLEGATIGSLFTPLGPETTVLFPGTNGGANWPGPSFDPETSTLFVNSMDVGMIFRMDERPAGSVVPYRARSPLPGADRFWDLNKYPCQQPPWAHLTAIDLRSGEFRWRTVLGVIDELTAQGIPPTGTSNLGGSLVTAGGLVFIGATNDSRFRAFDKDSGRELWETRLPASAHAAPMTFRARGSGRQHVVIAAGGGNKYNTVYSDELVAFRLP